MGNNQIWDWYSRLSLSDRAVTDSFLVNMRRTEDWSGRHFSRLTGNRDLARLGELRWKCGNVQHRLIGFMRGNDFAAMIGCTHKQQRYDPSSALETAVKRMKQIEKGEATLHEYDF